VKVDWKIWEKERSHPAQTRVVDTRWLQLLDPHNQFLVDQTTLDWGRAYALESCTDKIRGKRGRDKRLTKRSQGSVGEAVMVYGGL
jgi:hypothetical protein